MSSVLQQVELHFLLEAESTPGPWYGRKNEVNEKFLRIHSRIDAGTFWLVA